MNYERNLRRSWEIIKKNKVLWILGMLLGGAGSSFNGGGGGNSGNSFLREDFYTNEPISQFLENTVSFFVKLEQSLSTIPLYVWLTLGIILLILIIFLIAISIYLSNWAEGAVIGSMNSYENGEKITFRTAAKYGIKNAKDLIWISLVPGLIFSLLLIIFVLIMLLGLILPVDLLKILWFCGWGIFLFILILVGAFFLTYLKIISFRIVVIEEKRYWEAYKESFKIVKKSFLPLFLQGLINYVVGCLFGCFYLIAILIIIAVIAIGFIVHPGVGLSLIIPGVIFLIFSSVATGAFKAFESGTWTLFYRQLKEQEDKNEDK